MQQLVFSISEQHPSLAGHFPGNPVVPGVVLLEELTLKLVAVYSDCDLRGFTQVKFLNPVLPGQNIGVRLKTGGQGKVGFKAYRGELLVFSGELLCGSACP